MATTILPTTDQPVPAAATASAAHRTLPLGDEPPAWVWKGEIPSLSGLRAVSILVVIVSHVAIQCGIPISRLPVSGEMGVDMFFVISGFLITLLLLRNRQRTDAISIKRFYLRRGFRILPAYLVFLATLAVLNGLGVTAEPWKAWGAALTYTTNLVQWANWALGHTWSLAVEEHFYLCWPLLLVLLGPRRAAAGALVYVVLTPCIRMVCIGWFRHSVDVGAFTLTRIDTIAVGCCLAFVVASPRLRPRIALTARQAFLFGVGGVLFLLGSKALTVNAGHIRLVGYYGAFLSGSLNAVVLAGLVWICISHRGGVVGWISNSRPMVAIGLLSYSIYLWQQPILNPARTSWICRLPLNVLLILALATTSYFIVERPFLRLKERFEPKA